MVGYSEVWAWRRSRVQHRKGKVERICAAQRLAEAAEFAVAEPLGEAEAEEHQAKGETHQGDHQGQPAGVGVGAGAGDAAEDGEGEKGGDGSGDERPDAGDEQRAGAVVSLT